MTTTITAASRVAFVPGELNAQASTKPLIQFDNGGAFIVQADGNLVYYQGGVAYWHANSNVGSGDASKLILKFLEDGNLALYYNGTIKWQTSTGGAGKKLVISDSRPYIMVLDKEGDIAWYAQRSKQPGYKP